MGRVPGPCIRDGGWSGAHRGGFPCQKHPQKSPLQPQGAAIRKNPHHAAFPRERWQLQEHRYVASSPSHSSCFSVRQGSNSRGWRMLFGSCNLFSSLRMSLLLIRIAFNLGRQSKAAGSCNATPEHWAAFHARYIPDRRGIATCQKYRRLPTKALGAFNEPQGRVAE